MMKTRGIAAMKMTPSKRVTSMKAIIATAPIFLLGLLVQKHFVRGLTLGAIRG